MRLQTLYCTDDSSGSYALPLWLTDLSARASAAAHELQRERMAAAVALANPTGPMDPFRAQIGRSDGAIDAYTKARQGLGTVPSTVRDRLRSM